MTSDLLIIKESLKRANILTITRYFKVIRIEIQNSTNNLLDIILLAMNRILQGNNCEKIRKELENKNSEEIERID